jgi:hypothetical protein
MGTESPPDGVYGTPQTASNPLQGSATHRVGDQTLDECPLCEDRRAVNGAQFREDLSFHGRGAQFHQGGGRDPVQGHLGRGQDGCDRKSEGSQWPRTNLGGTHEPDRKSGPLAPKVHVPGKSVGQLLCVLAANHGRGEPWRWSGRKPVQNLSACGFGHWSYKADESDHRSNPMPGRLARMTAKTVEWLPIMPHARFRGYKVGRLVGWL